MDAPCTTRKGRWLVLGLLLTLAFARPGESRADGEQNSRVKLHFPKTDVREVLMFYGRLTKKPVLMELPLQAMVTVDAAQELSIEEAKELIRKTLLESYGIEMRESDRGEILATWSRDPKYPRHSDPPLTEEERRHRRVEVLQPLQ